MAKFRTNQELLNYLRGQRAIVAVSRQMGETDGFLSRALGSDPAAVPSVEFVQRVMDALDTVTNGAPSA